MTIFSSEDLAFYKDATGGMHAGGFKLNTIFNNDNMPMMSVPSQIGGGKSGNNILDGLTEGLAIPAGLFYLNTAPSQRKSSSENDEVAPNQLIDRLVGLMDPMNEKKTKMTRKKGQKQKIQKQLKPKLTFLKRENIHTKKHNVNTSKNKTRKSVK